MYMREMLHTSTYMRVSVLRLSKTRATGLGGGLGFGGCQFRFLFVYLFGMILKHHFWCHLGPGEGCKMGIFGVSGSGKEEEETNEEGNSRTVKNDDPLD